MIQKDKSATLATNNDQYLFQPITFEPGIASREGGHIYESVAGTLRSNAGDNQLAVAYGISSYESNSMKSSNPHSGIYEADTSRTLDANGGNPTCNQGGTIVIEGNGTRPSHQGDGYKESDVMYTLNTVDHHAVAFQTYQERSGPLMANSHPGSYTGQDAFNDMLVAGIDYRSLGGNHHAVAFRLGGFAKYIEGEIGTLRASGGDAGLGSENLICKKSSYYIVRRLTPTECARLQGFPDEWAHPDQKTELTDEEYLFWLNVRNTHAAINGKAVKQYTRDQMLRWYNGLHTDSAEYKLWGNGIALPCALYVMEGIAEELEKEETK